MLALMRTKLSTNTFRDLILFGKRYTLGGAEAAAAGLVTYVDDASANSAEAAALHHLDTALFLNGARTYDRGALAKGKEAAYADALEKLEDDTLVETMGFSGRAGVGADRPSKAVREGASKL